MAGHHLYVKGVTATEAITRLSAVANELFPGQPVNFDVSTNMPHVGLQLQNVQAGAVQDHPTLKEFSNTWSGRSALRCTAATLSCPNMSGASLSLNQQNSGYSAFNLNLPDGARVEAALKAIEKRFDVTPYVDLIVAEGAAASERNALQLRERALADLGVQVERLAALQAQLTVKDAEDRRAASASLDEAHRARQQQLDDAHQARQQELDARQAAREEDLAERMRRHAELEKSFEMREAKFVRRNLLTQIEAVLDKSKDFKLSDATAEKRQIVHRFTWLLMAISALTVVVLLAGIATGKLTGWQPFVHLGAASVTLVSTFIYYLKWNDRWFREHAEAELAATRYRADILRASWVAELVSEWQSEAEGDPPPELIAAFTRNLFRESGATRESEHPIEALTGMIKRVTAVTVGKGVVSVRGLSDEVTQPRRGRRSSRKAESRRAPVSRERSRDISADDA